MPGPRSATFDFFLKIFEKFLVKNILGPQGLSKRLNIDEKLYFAKDMLFSGESILYRFSDVI